MKRRWQTFLLALCLAALSTTGASGKEAAVNPREAKDLKKAAAEIGKLPDELQDAAEDFDKAAEALDKLVNKASRDRQFTAKEIDTIEKAARKLDREAAALSKSCVRITKAARKLVDTVEDATD